MLKNFFANRNKGAATSGKDLHLSKIFDWFNKDFMNATNNGAQSNFPNLASFLLKYTNNNDSMNIHTYVQNNQDAVNSLKNVFFFDYNWNLNGDIDKDMCSANRLCISYIYLIIAIGVIGIVVIIVVVVVTRRKTLKNYKEF